jgi:hypothetical protein
LLLYPLLAADLVADALGLMVLAGLAVMIWQLRHSLNAMIEMSAAMAETAEELAEHSRLLTRIADELEREKSQ